MTEQEWLTCTDSKPMLEFLGTSSDMSDRKMRLFACGCVRRVWHLLSDEASRTCVEIAENYADGGATPTDRHEAGRKASAATNKQFPTPNHKPLTERYTVEEGTVIVRLWAAFNAARGAAQVSSRKITKGAAQAVILSTATATWQATCTPKLDRPWELNRQGTQVWLREKRIQGGFIRDVFNPFHPVAINLSWLTPSVASFAQAAYEQRALPSGELDTARLAVLADALEEAGCDIPDILNHLRSPGIHVRGCWVVDLLLGKE